MLVKHGSLRQASGMTEAKPTREERLAAKLRENLRRRKAQSRAAGSREPGVEKPTLPKNEPSR